MANKTTIRPPVLICRKCGQNKALSGVTTKQHGLIIWAAVCFKCKEELRLNKVHEVK